MSAMTVSYFVRYQGRPADAAAFDRHYSGAHAAILRDFPGIEGLVLHRPVSWRDPFPVKRGETYLLAQMLFASEAALNAALASEARARARDDAANFPTFDGAVTHQAMRAEVAF
jgi:uncharacterized protein (TIGR02118 family)